MSESKNTTETYEQFLGRMHCAHTSFEELARWYYDDTARLRELQAVVDRLPKTADGVPVVLHDDVWVLDESGRPWIGRVYLLQHGPYRHRPIWCADPWRYTGEGECNEGCQGTDSKPVERCYSTRAAALAARDNAEVGEELIAGLTEVRDCLRDGVPLAERFEVCEHEENDHSPDAGKKVDDKEGDDAPGE